MAAAADGGRRAARRFILAGTRLPIYLRAGGLLAGLHGDLVDGGSMIASLRRLPLFRQAPHRSAGMPPISPATLLPVTTTPVGDQRAHGRPLQRCAERTVSAPRPTSASARHRNHSRPGVLPAIACGSINWGDGTVMSQATFVPRADGSIAVIGTLLTPPSGLIPSGDRHGRSTAVVDPSRALVTFKALPK